MNSRYLILIFVLFLLALPPAYGQKQAPSPLKKGDTRVFSLPEKALYLDGRIIFRVRESYRSACGRAQLSLPGLNQTLSRLGTAGLSQTFPGHQPPARQTDAAGREMVDLSLIYTVEFDPSTDMEAAVNSLLIHPEIEYAEPWYIYETFYQPNDPYADTTAGVNLQWFLGQIQAREAWDVQKGDTSVVVGVIDTGISYDHPDLVQNLSPNPDDPPDGLDNDGDGYIDNFRGWDFGGNTLSGPGDNDASYNEVHGVAVAGALGATADNGIGTAGVSFNCRYLPLKASPDDLPGYITHGYQAMVYAADQGAQIINCSWGGSNESRFGEEVVNYVTLNRGAAVVAACGNSQADEKFYPASYVLAISVANTREGDTLFWNSTFNYSVDVSAPGDRIMTPFFQNQYFPAGGTSLASPVTAGAIALTLAHFPGLSGFQAAQRVRVTTDNHYSKNGINKKDKLGTGRINLLRALTDGPKPSIRSLGFQLVDEDHDLIMEDGDTISLPIEFINYLDATEHLVISASVLPSQASYISLIEDTFLKGEASTLERFGNDDAPFRLFIIPGAPTDLDVFLRISYRDTVLGYEDFEYLEFRINASYLNIVENELHTSVTSTGNWGFNDMPFNTEGLGISYKSGDNVLFEGGFLVAADPNRVSDNIRNTQNIQDKDFRVVERIHEIPNPYLSDYFAVGEFNDSSAQNPIGLGIRQEVYGFSNPGDDDYVILRYLIKNNNPVFLPDLYTGLFADLDPGNYKENACSFDTTAGLIYAWDLSGEDLNYYGIALLSDGQMRSQAATNPGSFVFNSDGKFNALTSLPSTGNSSIGALGAGEDIMQLIGEGPFSLTPLSTHSAGFALLAGDDLADLRANAIAAKQKYKCIILGEGPVIPFSLSEENPVQGESVFFQDNNPNSVNWEWNFGDGTVLQGVRDPVHIYQFPGNYTVTLTVSDGNCSFTSIKEIVISTLTDIAGFDGGQLRLYPNPSSGSAIVEWEGNYTGPVSLILTDAAGKLIQNHAFFKDGNLFREQIGADNLPAGFYLLRLSGTDCSHTLRWIRQ